MPRECGVIATAPDTRRAKLMGMLCTSDGHLQPLPQVLATLVIHGQSACFCICVCTWCSWHLPHSPRWCGRWRKKLSQSPTQLRGGFLDSWLCQGPGICTYLQIIRHTEARLATQFRLYCWQQLHPDLGAGKAGKWGSC